MSLTHELTEITQKLNRRKHIHDCKTELERYKVFQKNDIAKEEAELKCKEALGLLAKQKHDFNESAKLQAYKTFKVKDELENKMSLQEMSLKLPVHQKEQLKKDFKIREDKDINKLIALENQVKFLNNIVYKIGQFVQTIHMLTPKLSSYYNVKNDLQIEKEIKKEMFEDLKYVKSLENVVDELQSKNYDFSKEYDLILAVTVVGARDTVGTQVVQRGGIQCFDYKGFGHYDKVCRAPKRAKDYAYHKEKILLCKDRDARIQLSAKQEEILYDTDEEPTEQELEAHYMYMAKIQEVLLVTADATGPIYDTEHIEQPETINDLYVMEKVDSNTTLDSSDMSNNE
ncbi:hypothetical protein Tco_0837459 [Tanacetum coccineum]